MHRYIAGILLVLICAAVFTASADDTGYGRGELGFGSSYISDTIPDRLEPGHSYPVLISFKNTGLIVWESKTSRVGMVYSGDMGSVISIPSFVEIPRGATVPPGKEVSFALSLLPVGIPGEYRLPFFVVFRNAQGDQQVTEIFEKRVTIVPTDGVSSPQNGSIVVESPLPGLEVLMNRQSMGPVPCIIPDLVPGLYEVEVEGDTFRRSFPVDVRRGTLSRVYVDNSTAEPLIRLKKIGVVSDGTLFGYVEANIPLIIIVTLFLLGCIGLMIHAVRVRREEEGDNAEKEKKGSKQEKDQAEDEKDLLDEYHAKTHIFEAAKGGSDPGSGSSTGGAAVHDSPAGPMKNVRRFSRDMLEVNQEMETGKQGIGGGHPGSVGEDSSGGVTLSMKNLQVRPGFAKAHVSAFNQTGKPLFVEGVEVGAGLTADISVDLSEPDDNAYEMTISLKILDSAGQSFLRYLLVPYNRGIALLARGVLEKAYEYYQGFVHKNPRHIDALLHKAQILMEWGLEDEAGEVLDTIHSLDPENESALLLSGEIDRIRKKKEQERRVQDKPKIAGFPDLMSDRYTPIRLLGRDAFASIILAIRNDTGDLRALKIAREDADVGSSVYTEISVLYQLRHGNVLKMFRAEFHPHLFLELEYASGVSCGDHLCRTLADLTPPVPVDVMYTLMEGIASGLAYIHSKGVRHYHLSPKYILLDEPMVPKISGLMRASLIQTGSGKEDPLVVRAPEQLHPERYGKPGRKTDLFQMGVIWYWLITGTIPYQSGSVSDGDNQTVLSGVYISPAIRHPQYARYDPLMRRLLALDKRERYSSADEFLAELKGIHMSETVREPAPGDDTAGDG